MKIGILTFHRAINYGAYLQAVALCNSMIEEGFDAEIIDFRMKVEERWYSHYRKYWPVRVLQNVKELIFKHKLTKSIESGQDDAWIKKSKEYLCSDSSEDLKKLIVGKYDVVITGSDEVWKIDSFRGFPSPYWLPNINNIVKVSYAASSRNSIKECNKEVIEQVDALLDSYKYISVRDQMSFELIKECKKDKLVHIDCDPSFLYKFNVKKVDLKNYLNGKARLDENKKNVVVMVYDPSHRVVDYIVNSLEGRYNLIGVAERHPRIMNIADLSPREWLTVIANADFVISSFFHGVCFSIMNNTPFIAIETVQKKSKVYYLLRDTELKDRFVDYKEYVNVDINDMIKKYSADSDFTCFCNRQRVHFPYFLDYLRNVEQEMYDV